MLEQFFYNLMAENAFLKKQGGEFQDFVNDILGYRYGSDFVRIRPHGKDGDFKCDGRIPKQGIIFQCYAPENMTDKKIIDKIREDFEGALKEWSDTKKWIFIHNVKRGISPRASQTLDALGEENPNVAIAVWDRQKLETITLALDESYLIRLFGYCPIEKDFNSVTNKDVQNMGHLIRGLLGQYPDFDKCNDLDPVVPSKDKLSKNNLSESAMDFIKQGRRKSSLVGSYLLRFPDPDYAETCARKFKEKYQNLKKEGYNPNQIFGEICVFLGSQTFSSATETACMFSYMAYFFDKCSIFEDPKEEPPALIEYMANP